MGIVHIWVVVIQSPSLFETPWIAVCQTPLSFTISQSLLKFMSIELVTLSNHLILCHPFLLLPSILPSIRVFSNESALCIRWPKDWGFSFSISPSNEYSGLNYFRMDWLDLLAAQGALQSLSSTTLLKHHFFGLSLPHGSTFIVATVQLPIHVQLCNPMDCSTTGFSVPHHLLKFAQVHDHCISDAIQPSHPLTPSSPFALNISQYQGLFQWVSCSHQMTKILELQLQHQSFQRVLRVDFP